jgi:hypothetical protein
MNEQEATDLFKKVDDLFTSKQASALVKSKEFVPGIAANGKVVLLPDTVFSRPDNAIVSTMALLAIALGFEVRLLPYADRAIYDITPQQQKVAAGISFAALDVGRKLNVKRKTDDYEYGRTIARAQQTIGIFQDQPKLTLDSLKRTHRWFGNNPKETEGTGRLKVPVVYTGKDLEQYFLEQEWKSPLASLLSILLRKSHKLLEADVVNHAILDSIISYSESVVLYQSTKVTTVPAQGRKPAVQVEKVPHKPKANSLMLKEEMELVSSHIDNLFRAVDVGDKEAWVNLILDRGFPAMKQALKTNCTQRAQFLTKFAAMTTKRLNGIRSLSDAHKIKRKRDVTSDDVVSMLLRRTTPLAIFADELMSLDPGFTAALRPYGKTNHKGDLDVLASKEAIRNNVSVAMKGHYAKLDIVTRTVEIHKDGHDLSSPLPLDLAGMVERDVQDHTRHRWVRSMIKAAWEAGAIKSQEHLRQLVNLLSAETNKKAKFDSLKGPEQGALARDIIKKVTGVALTAPVTPK